MNDAGVERQRWRIPWRKKKLKLILSHDSQSTNVSYKLFIIIIIIILCQNVIGGEFVG